MGRNTIYYLMLENRGLSPYRFPYRFRQHTWVRYTLTFEAIFVAIQGPLDLGRWKLVRYLFV